MSEAVGRRDHVVEGLAPLLSAFGALLREALTPEELARFLALSERNLEALTLAVSRELSLCAAAATRKELASRVLSAMTSLQ